MSKRRQPSNRTTPRADEKAGDKEQLDKEFKDHQAKLKEKLEREKKFSNWTYQVSTYVVEPLLKHRRELLEKEAKETSPAKSAD